MNTIDFFQDENGDWRFRVKGGNGEIVAASESYASESNARRGADHLFQIIQKEAKPAETAEERVELTEEEANERVDDLLAASWCYLSAARDGNGFDYRQYPMAWPWEKEKWAPGTKGENIKKAIRLAKRAHALYNERTATDE